jgi:prepilin-type N-terminal cleavage/methylation domain-containing protein
VKKRTLEGFTLIELLVVVVIIGILAFGIMQGSKVTESARIVATIDEIKKIYVSVISYQADYGSLPGDDPNANTTFGGTIEAGAGNGVINNDKAWSHLKAAELINTIPTPSLGGQYDFINNERGNFLRLSADGKGKELKADGNSIILADGVGSTKNDCIKESGQLNLAVKSKSCILLVSLD